MEPVDLRSDTVTKPTAEILHHLCPRARGMLVTNLTVKDGPSEAVRYFNSAGRLGLLVDGTIICGYPTLGDPDAPTSHIASDPDTVKKECSALHRFLRDETRPAKKCETCGYFERECFGLPRCSRYLEGSPKKS